METLFDRQGKSLGLKTDDVSAEPSQTEVQGGKSVWEKKKEGRKEKYDSYLDLIASVVIWGLGRNQGAKVSQDRVTLE